MIYTKRNNEETASWRIQKTRLREVFPSITDEDVNYDHNNKHEMLEKLSVKLGKTPPELLTVLRKG